MDAKPLTKEEYLEIKRRHSIGKSVVGDFDDVLAAEKFWREAVASLRNTGVICPFNACRVDIFSNEHKPDCPWLLAQE